MSGVSTDYLRPAKRNASILRLAVALAFGGAAWAEEIHVAQGVMAGEVTATSVILQTRLTATPAAVDGDVPGAPGVVCFELSRDASFREKTTTPWQDTTAERDYIVKAVVTGLEPDTRYHYRVLCGPDVGSARPRAKGVFRTLPGPQVPATVRFVVTSCMSFRNFHEGRPRAADDLGPYRGPDRHLGFPTLDTVRQLEPAFFIINGDAVYYDSSMFPERRAKTQAELRQRWHEQYVTRRFVDLFAAVPGYWLKDDHDYRMNDSDPTGDYPPSHELAVATFREQVPVVDLEDRAAETYRTHRVGKDLQLWFVENRDYRSPNKAPDGPGKSIWGARQTEWLKRTLLESDATFKVLISPTPMVGPDDATKADNHVNAGGFRHEAREFFAWLGDNGIAPGRFFILCGDRHWKYHSRHPSGYDEIGCGALTRENSRLGAKVKPGTAVGSTAEGPVQLLYTDAQPSGGFLQVALRPGAGGDPAQIDFTLHDVGGQVLYRHRPTRP